MPPSASTCELSVWDRGLLCDMVTEDRMDRIIAICLYKRNQGLGACVGPVSRVKAASAVSTAAKGLRELAERLAVSGEAPGVCTAHEQRAAENGFVLDVSPPEAATEKKPRAPARKAK